MDDRDREIEAHALNAAMHEFDAVLERLYGKAVSVTIVAMDGGAWVMSQLDTPTTIRMLETALQRMRDGIDRTTFTVEES